MDKTQDYFCLGSCMSYCDECKWYSRWKEVGEDTKEERMEKWPALLRIKESQCQLMNGAMFRAKDISA